jgi:dihydroorotate dehydrogenase electron transfer subunit
MVRSCVDGPVFQGDLVRWDDVGTIPFDALGAPGWKPRPPPEPQPADRPTTTGRLARRLGSGRFARGD